MVIHNTWKLRAIFFCDWSEISSSLCTKCYCYEFLFVVVVVVVVFIQTSEISLISNSPLHCSRTIILLTCTWSRKFYLHVSFEVKLHMRSVKRENSAELPWALSFRNVSQWLYKTPASLQAVSLPFWPSTQEGTFMRRSFTTVSTKIWAKLTTTSHCLFKSAWK